ncbi:conjugative transposon protein TraN [Chitinophaga sp. Hz27]|uniref:conjugative transposon protein TraN n=1 Tax=Chitinophaga sp. Hz27 TaxID=3347169 RepID=UPI0035D9EADC
MMKCVIGIAVLFCIGKLPAMAQYYDNLKPLRVAVSYSKTSNLIFPYAVTSVDRGSRDLMVQKAKGVKNILQLKAGKEDFKETNLSVVTADGRFYSFLVCYESSPSVLNLRFRKLPDDNKEYPAVLSTDTIKVENVERNADLVRMASRKGHGPHDKNFSIKAHITSIYIKDDIFYFRVCMKNSSAINFYTDQLNFSIRDKNVAKRTAYQEKFIAPAYTSGETGLIKANTESILVFAVPKFTIPDKKQLYLLITEKDGGRSIKLRIKNRHLIRAFPII